MGALGVMNRVLAVTLAAGAMALSSCSRIAEHAFAQPTIAVRSVKLKSIGLTGGSIEVALAIAIRSRCGTPSTPSLSETPPK